MIIYQAQPNSRYPLMTAELAYSLGVWHYNQMFVFEEKDKSYAIEHNLIDTDNFLDNPVIVKPTLNYDGICYSIAGYFNMDNYVKKPDDFSFTLLTHPVDNFYTFYYFCNVLLRRLKSEIIANEPMSKRDMLMANVIESFGTFNEYVDKFLENNGTFYLNFEDMNIFLNKVLFNCSLFKNHDFYGIVDTPENEKYSLTKLSQLLNITPRFNLEGTIAKTDNNTYRRNEIEKLLEKDTEFYQQKLTELRNSMEK